MSEIIKEKLLKFLDEYEELRLLIKETNKDKFKRSELWVERDILRVKINHLENKLERFNNN